MSELTEDEKIIFEAASSLADPAQRAEYLDVACRANVELRQQIDALLGADEQAGNFLRKSAVDLPEPRRNLDPAADASEQIGRYKLLQMIGEGGFGIVYMAEQRQPVYRRVALKVIKAGMDTKQVIGRFEAERQALAMMDHPNIAKILDAGATDTGRPYFVMELVHGVPITEFCDRNEFEIAARLDLFIHVCYAVQHAHQKGIIHRDIKPSNVMVTLHDDKPVPKVIDFGIAKATQQPLTERTVFTEFKQFLGTPAYMSPEQASLNGMDIDTRSDIYALGVLLYELLTGTTPYDEKKLHGLPYDELCRVIREDRPPTPSSRVSTLGAQLVEICRTRSTEPGLLRRLLRGDVDWIVMKALEKDRTRRYETASAFASDIQRYLNHEPVLAGPPSTVYRLRKYVQRNRLAVTSAVVVVLALLLGTVATTVGFVQSRLGWKQALTSQNKLEQQLIETARISEQYRQRLYFLQIIQAHAALAKVDITRAREMLKECPEDLRCWEWHYMNRLAKPRELMILPNSWSPLFTPDGRDFIATSKESGLHRVKVWDAETGRFNRTIGSHPRGLTMNLSPDGRWCVGGGPDGVVKLFDTAAGRVKWSVPVHAMKNDGVTFSPDGKSIVAVSWDQTVKTLSAETGEVRFARTAEHQLHSVRFSPDGQRFVTAFNHGGSPQARDVQVWNAATGEQILALRGHDAVPTSATYSPDGRWVVTGSVDQTIKIWNAATGEPMWTLRGHTGPVYSVDVSPDGTLIASGGEDTTIRLWDTVTKRELAKLRGQTSGSYWLVFSPDSRKLASCAWPSIEIRVWDLAAVQPDVRMLRGHFYPLTGITFSPDGRQIASIGIDGTIRLWDVATGQPIRTLRRPGEWLCATAYFIVHRAAEWLYDVAYDPKGELLASGGMDREVTLWNVASGQEVQKLRGHQGDVRSVAFSPDGSRVATGSDDGTARVWNVATGQVLLSLEGHGDAVRQVAFSPDGARIASCSADKTLRLWDAVTGMELRTLSGHEAAVTCLAVSWKGKWIASGSEDGTIKIWNSVTGQEDRSLRGHGEVVLSVTFTTDDERVFSSSSDATVKLWDRTSGQELITLLENTWFPFVAVSRDGKTVAAAADDATIRIWEAAEPRQGESPTRLTAEIASRLVDARFKQLSFASDVIESLRTDDTLSEARRGVALEIATARGDNIVQLTYESWAIVRASGHDIDTYRRALHKAEVVSRLAPQSTGALDTLGVAHYRVGNYADALAILERAEQLRAAVPGSDREIPDEVTGRRKYPVVATNAHAVAFIAMSLHRLGRADEARAALDRLRTLVEKKMWSTDATAKQFLVEAEQLVD